MITLHFDGFEIWYDEKEEFGYYPPIDVDMEHSLAAIAGWEGRWKKPYMSALPMYEKTPEEFMDYICRMAINKPKDFDLYVARMSSKELLRLKEYLEDTHSAARFSNKPGRPKRSGLSRTGEDTTAETIYYQMIQLGIPFECENWNVNRLLSLINYCALKETKGEKMSRKDIIQRNAALNEMRKARRGAR